MSNDGKPNDASIKVNVLGEDLILPSTKHISATMPIVVGFILGIVIPLGMFVVFKDGCTETLQVKTPVPIEILHYRPALMVACVLIMSLFLLGLYALHCHSVHCIVREDGKVMGMRRDILLRAMELSEKLSRQEEMINRKNVMSINIHYHFEDWQNISSKSPKRGSDEGNLGGVSSYKAPCANTGRDIPLSASINP